MDFKIFKHYFFRAAKEPIGFSVFILFPVVLVFLMSMINEANIEGYYHIYEGYNTIASISVIMIMLMFQFMGGSYISDFVFLDFKSARKWRLLAAPLSLNKFLFSALSASILFSIFSGLLILGVGIFFFDIYFGNWWMILAVLILMAFIGQFLGLLIALLSKKKSMSESLIQIIAWATFILGGFFGNFDLPLLGDLFRTYGTPFAAGLRAIQRSGIFLRLDYNPETGMNTLTEVAFRYDMNSAMLSLGVLAGFAVALGAAAFIAGRRRPL